MASPVFHWFLAQWRIVVNFASVPGRAETIARSSLCYFQTVRGRVQRLIAGCYYRPETRHYQRVLE
jgi:hypothetical protein